MPLVQQRFKPIDYVTIALIVFVATALPRVLVMFGLPSTDEGYYAYDAQFIHASLVAGHGLPDEGRLSIYPALVSWVFDLPYNSLIMLRFVDLTVASAASVLLFLIVYRESASRLGAAVIAGLFIFTMNQPAFVQAGYKNSIHAAYVPLFVAMLVSQRILPTNAWRWWIVGALTAISVLVRETFVSFAVVGAIAVLLGRGRKAASHFVVGGLATGGLIVGAILIARGGLSSMLNAYSDAGAIYKSFEVLRRDLFIANATVSAKTAAAALVVTLMACLSLAFTRVGTSTVGSRALFWIACASVPLVEPATKIGFPYHFAVSLPGLAGLCAYAWERGSRKWGHKFIVAGLAVCAAGIATQYPKYEALFGVWPGADRAKRELLSPYWTDESSVQSNYLLAARMIRDSSRAGDTLSISGYMQTLYPLSGLLPPSNDVSNLSATFAVTGFDSALMFEVLKSCPASVVVTSNRADVKGSAELDRIVRASGLYETVATIPLDAGRSYGHFGGTIYKRSSDGPSTCDTSALRKRAANQYPVTSSTKYLKPG